VDALAVSGPTVYAVGSFESIGGQARSRIAALDAITGVPTSWDPNAYAFCAPYVAALAVSGSTVYAGGYFMSIGGQTRSNIAALGEVTGGATSWDPNANHEVLALAVSGSTVYAGGAFTSIGGLPHSYFAGFRIRPSTHAVAPEPHARGLLQDPGDPELAPVMPNPTSGPAQIQYVLPRDAHLRVQIFDVMGREVALLTDAVHPAGSYETTWDGRGVAGPAAAGVYFVRFESGGLSTTRRLTLVR
jgi:hypothetical protein